MTSLHKGFLGIVLSLSLASQAQAAVTLMDQNDWKVLFGGFVETDVIMDTTRSFNESVGNAAVADRDTVAGQNGRTAFSDRNSRLAFTLLPPVQNDWKTKGYFELDFLGYEPSIGAGTTVSESAFYSNPAIRIRHANFTMEKNGWNFLVGQSWSLFGWQPYYVLTTASVAPGPGILYQRNLQLTMIKSMAGDENTLQAGVSIARPTQRDSNTPNIDLGLRWALNGYRSGFAGATGDAKAESLSVGLSGTFRQFVSADSAATNSALTKTSGSAFAADILVPLVPANDKDVSNTLTLTAEYSAGTGYGDELPGWSGGIGAIGTNSTTYLDGGIGVASAAGGLDLVKLQTTSAQLQYHFSTEIGMFLTAGYSETTSSNVKELGGTYDKTNMTYVNLFKDLTNQIRVAAEYSVYKTSYVVGTTPENDRYQLSAYFRF